MGIFDRLSTLIRSNINDLINRAENPEKMLNQLIVDMRSQLAKAKQQVASAIADERSEEHTSELQSRLHLVCRLLLEKKKGTPVACCRSIQSGDCGSTDRGGRHGGHAYPP